MTNFIFRFQKFPVYKDALRFRVKVKKIVSNNFPDSEKYSLSSQALRATISIILNIAEGADRSTDKDFALFLNRSLTSLNEVVSCFDIAVIEQYVTKQIYQDIIEDAQQLAGQLSAFRKSILKNNR